MIKHLIAKGIGFFPLGTKWIVTHGFAIFIPPPMIVSTQGGFGDLHTLGGQGDATSEGGGVG